MATDEERVVEEIEKIENQLWSLRKSTTKKGHFSVMGFFLILICLVLLVAATSAIDVAESNTQENLQTESVVTITITPQSTSSYNQAQWLGLTENFEIGDGLSGQLLLTSFEKSFDDWLNNPEMILILQYQFQATEAARGSGLEIKSLSYQLAAEEGQDWSVFTEGSYPIEQRKIMKSRGYILDRLVYVENFPSSGSIQIRIVAFLRLEYSKPGATEKIKKNIVTTFFIPIGNGE